MKTLTLKEAQAPYTLTIDQDALAQHLMLTRQDGQPVGILVPYDEYRVFRTWRQGRKKVFTADDALQALIASGEVRLSDLGEHLRMNLIPGATLERVHEALAGVSVPIEEMIREEREKYVALPGIKCPSELDWVRPSLVSAPRPRCARNWP